MAPLRVSTTKSEWLPDDPTAFVPTRLWKLPFITTWDDSRNQNRPTDSAEEALIHKAKLPVTASDLKIAIGYVRLAAEPQRDSKSGLTPQTEQVRAIAGANGIDLVEVIADTGQTGLTLKRPGLQRLLAAIEAGVIGTVVVSELSRLSRSRSDLERLLNLFDRCGVALVLGTEGFDSEGAEMIFTVVAYEVTELTRTVEAESVEEAIALAYHGPDTDWSEWSETTLGTNGIEVVFAECGESVYDAGTRASMPIEDFEGKWQ